MDSPERSRFPDPVGAFTPRMEVAEELEVLQTARKSLGGEALKPIEIDMDILVDAYPREGNFLASSTTENSSGAGNVAPSTPNKPISGSASIGLQSSRKTPNRRFFKSEHEREYARNLMKELVQIYILQGVHGKEAFRNALNETRKRIHLRRGEPVPTPPAVLSPVNASPYPKLSPPKEIVTPYSERTSNRAVEATPNLPVKRLDTEPDGSASPRDNPLQSRGLPAAPRTPSRVKSMVAAIQSSTPGSKSLAAEMTQRTPGTSRVKAVAETLEGRKSVRTISTPSGTSMTEVHADRLSPSRQDKPSTRNTPATKRTSPKKKEESMESEISNIETTSEVVDQRSPVKATPPSKRKNQDIVEKLSATRGRKKDVEVEPERAVSPPVEERKRVRRAAAIAAEEELLSAKKSRVVAVPPEDMVSAKKSRKQASEEPEEQSVTKSVRKSAAPKKTKGATKRKKVSSELETIPEDEAVAMPPRPVRKAAKNAAKKV